MNHQPSTLNHQPSTALGYVREQAVKAACGEWFDVRAFGQVFPFKGKKQKKGSPRDTEQSSEKDADGISIQVRGPVTLQSAFSIERIDVESSQIAKSTSLEGDGEKRQSDQLGMKHRVDRGIYVCYGSINPQLAERTGFTDEDASVIYAILPKLFENDASSARPDGSMEVLKVIWWKHRSKAGQHSSAKVHRSLTVNPDGSIELVDLEGLKPDVRDGF